LTLLDRQPANNVDLDDRAEVMDIVHRLADNVDLDDRAEVMEVVHRLGPAYMGTDIYRAHELTLLYRQPANNVDLDSILLIVC
jgi:ABC-type cobalamin/Fe3+-siderophores transport system ATPase subunit